MHEPDYGLMSYERLMRYALRLTGRRADAEDLVQTAYLRALEHGDALYDQGPEAWSAWLHRTVRNAFIDQCRRRARQVLTQEEPQAAWEDDLTGLEVRDLLSRLPEHLAEPLRLRCLEGLNSTQIAERLHMPAATVRTRLRAAAMLIKKWKGEGKL